ncbi:uncharacterized protein LOC143587456 [Bidens hawaiensis]|uniref:uncharacterized protein LOC143587456 n=1 Tax=Bidens hawaiensis TaxID=980011 RepID=UPI004049F458
MDSYVEQDANENYGVGIVRTSPRSGMKYYAPDVLLSKRPNMGMIFQTVYQALAFYVNYAKLGGFTVIENFTKADSLNDSEASDPTHQRRNRPSIRTGCHAHLKLSLSDNNTYKVYAFLEEHNHPLIDASNYQFTRGARKLTYVK